MNKFERRLKGYHKWKKRMCNLGLSTEFQENPNLYIAYKTSGKPCSCWICKNEKYNRKIKHRNRYE